MTHCNSPTCECKPCVVIRQHKAIQAYGAAGKEPVCMPEVEPVSFTRSDDDAQMESLSKRDIVKDSYWHGFTHGAVVSLLTILALTAAILWLSH